MYKTVSNVWFSKDRSPEEVRDLQARSNLMWQIKQRIYRNQWSQEEAAKQLGISEDTVNYILSGTISAFTKDRLEKILSQRG